MNFLIENYHSGFQIVKVSYQEDIEGINVLYVHENYMCFKNIDDSYPLLDAFYEGFNEGDIISVNEYGLIHKLFDSRFDEATIFITGQCNSNCIMCPCSDYERKYNVGYSDSWLQVYLDLLPDHLGTIVITGGEPTLKLNQFYMVLEYVRVKFLDSCILILSNGRSFSSHVLMEKLLENRPKYLQIAIPIHGSSEKIHDRITQTVQSFHQTFIGIKKLLSAHIDIELRVVVSKMNIHDLVNIAYLICKEFPTTRFVNFIGLETLGNCAKNYDQVFISYDECFTYIKPAIHVLMEKGIETALYNYPLCMVDKGYWSLCRKSISPYKVRYLPECTLCTAKSYCGGFFASTLMVSNPKVKPIVLNEEL